MAEDANDKIQRVAAEIQGILVREHMAMVPTISLQIVPERPSIITPEDVASIITP